MLVALMSLSCLKPCVSGDFSINFYGEHIFDISIPNSKKILFKGNTTSEQNILKYLESLDKNESIRKLHDKIGEIKVIYGLNDYFEYLLAERIFCVICPKASSNQREILTFHYLSRSDYKVGMVVVKKKISLFAATDLKVYQMQKAKIRGKGYYNISRDLGEGMKFQVLSISRGARLLSMGIKTLPKFRDPVYELKKKNYTYLNEEVELTLLFNKNVLNFMADVPQLETSSYFGLELTDSLEFNLLNHLNGKISGFKTDQEKIRYLLSFVRTLKPYKDDIEAFGRERPLFPEESFYYDFLDCEDKSVMFGILVKYLLNLDYVALQYNNHVNLAILLKGEYKHTLEEEELQYVICEPSNSEDGLGIGNSPDYNSDDTYKVVYKTRQ